MNETEIYRRFRPKAFKQVIGQESAVSLLQDLLKRNAVPHVLLFTGPSGSGKTTLARIMKDKLECTDINFSEINAAKERGIEMVRDISDSMSLAPMGGKCRIWLIDECARLTPDGQSSLLKMFEDTPDHVYFFLATTDPEKLLKTIQTRCTRIRCDALSEENIKILVRNIAIKEKRKLDLEVIDAIAERSEGSARQALVFMHLVLGQVKKELQLKAIERSDIKTQGFDLAKALFAEKPWKEIAAILKGMKGLENDTSYERVRQTVLSYATTIILGGGKMKRADAMYKCFQFNFFDNKFSGLVNAAFECCHTK